MPIISIFFGIIVRIYHDDHNPPHFHVEYAEYKAVIAIVTGKMIKGKVPKQMARLIEEWRRTHVGELQNAWKDAQMGKSPRRIRPLR